MVVGALVATNNCVATIDELSLLLFELLTELFELSELNEPRAKARLPESLVELSELSLPESETVRFPESAIELSVLVTELSFPES